MTATTVDEAARQARFVFLGTIVRLNAATEAAIPLTDSTAVVHVDDVLYAPAPLGEQADREITVQLLEAEPREEGLQAVFFTDPWLYGEGLAVIEVERRQPEESKNVREWFSNNNDYETEDAVKGRLNTAVLVVVGLVTNTRPLTPGQPPIVTEHDPDWWEAVIAIRSVLKGEWQAPTITAVFAASMDVMWFQTPKLVVRQQGIFLLHRETAPNLPPEAFVLMDPFDALAIDQLDLVRRLLGGGPTPPTGKTPKPRRGK